MHLINILAIITAIIYIIVTFIELIIVKGKIQSNNFMTKFNHYYIKFGGNFACLLLMGNILSINDFINLLKNDNFRIEISSINIIIAIVILIIALPCYYYCKKNCSTNNNKELNLNILFTNEYNPKKDSKLSKDTIFVYNNLTENINVDDWEFKPLEYNSKLLITKIMYILKYRKVLNVKIYINNLNINNNFSEDNPKITKLEKTIKSYFEKLNKKSKNLKLKIVREFSKIIIDNNKIYNSFIEYHRSIQKNNKVLPVEKINKCLYQKSNELTSNDYKEFNSLYINKEIYQKIDNSRVRIDLIHHLLGSSDKNENILLLGEPGCGKSMFLIHTYLTYLNNEKDKVIPIFIELKELKDIDEIINRTWKSFLSDDDINEESNFEFYKIRKLISLDKNKILDILSANDVTFVLMFDSLDESGIIEKIDQFLNHIDSNFSINNGKNYKIKKIVAGRDKIYSRDGFKNFYNRCFKLITELRVFNINEVNDYLTKLTEMSKINEKTQLDIIEAINLIAINEKINPFIVSLITDNFMRNTRINREIKIVNLLSTSVENAIWSLGAKDLKDVYNIIFPFIGIKTKLSAKGNKELIRMIARSLLPLDFESVINKSMEELKLRTYLIDNEGNYYQECFADFFAAKFLIIGFESKYCNRSIYNELLDNFIELENDFQYFKEVFEYFSLLTDYSISDQCNDSNISLVSYIDSLSSSPMKHLLDYMFKKIAEGGNKNKCYDILISMLKSLDKYTGKKPVKDNVPKNISATYDAERVIQFIYNELLYFFIVNKEEIDYGYFYHFVNCIDYHELALMAVINSYNKLKNNQLLNNDSKSRLFKMLSVIRDSYLFLNYPYSTHIEKIETRNLDLLCSLSTNGKAISEMSHRELLNYSFYQKQTISYLSIKEEIKNLQIDELFPTIFNLNLFIDGYPKPSGKNRLADEREEAFRLDGSIRIIDISNNNEINAIEQDVLTLCIFTSNPQNNAIHNQFVDTINIRSIDVARGIKTLEANCFDNCLFLRNIILPDTITEIDDFGLYECNNLQNLILPETLEELGESFIEDCSSLINLKIPTNVKRIGDFAFEGCASLKPNFQNNNPKLGVGLFKYCKSIDNITKLNISKEIEILPDFTFRKCYGMKIIDLSDFKSLKTIGKYAFCNCDNVEIVRLPSSISKIDMLAFECFNLKKIIFEEIPLEISNYIFGNIFENRENYELELVLNNESYKVKSLKDANGLFNALGVNVINDLYLDDLAFSITKKSDEYILDVSFNDKLENIDFSKYLKEYENCFGKNIKIVGTGKGAFGDNIKLKEIRFNDDLMNLSEWTFEDCTSLYVVDLSTTKIKSLEAHTFENCTALEEVILPPSLRIIKESAFRNCLSVKVVRFNEKDVSNNKLIIPDYIEKIETHAFYRCEQIKSIQILSSNIEIESYSFDGMKQLREIYLCREIDINKLHKNCFSGCINLQNIFIGEQEISQDLKDKLAVNRVLD